MIFEAYEEEDKAWFHLQADKSSYLWNRGCDAADQ
jgi:hypothetical protein